MRNLWFSLLIVAVCSPLALVLLLFAETRLPSLDRITVHEPQGVRRTIASVVLQNAGYGKDAGAKVDRVLRLDPENADVWTRRCTEAAYQTDASPRKLDAIVTCKHALAVGSTEANWRNLGRADEKAGSYCKAQEDYAAARQLLTGDDGYTFQSLGRAALLCGHVDVALIELKQAADADEAAMLKAKADEDDLDDYRSSLVTDREWLTFAYANTHQPALASQACGLAHPDWKSCRCEVHAGQIQCDGEEAGAKSGR